jgi:subtilisin family serine protease/subtilisin-like proprotein convertase family protein
LILILAIFTCAPLARTASAASDPYWVFFADRSLTGEQQEVALARAQAELPARTAARRAKMGTTVVSEADLPLHAPYVAAVQATGARLRQQSRWLNAASIDATREQLAAVAALPFVTRVAPVLQLRRLEPSSAAALPVRGEQPWSLDYGLSLAALEQIGVPSVHELGINGQGVVIGMLDTGFRTTHESLQHLPVLAAHDFINGDDVVDNQPGDPPGQYDHGTKTLSTVAAYRPGSLVGPAFGASVILAKTEDTSQEVPIEEDFWVAGLEWVESLGADVVSSSLGYSNWYQFSDMDGNTAVTTIAADLAAARGVCVVNSAGNERNTSWGHIIAPADGDDVITAGAVNLAGEIAWFSSPGPTYDGRIKPDVCALGVSTPVANPDADHQYTAGSGTSYSCPLIAGVAALVLSRVPSLTPLQVREALRATADRAANPDNDFGWGVLDAFAAVYYWGPRLVYSPIADTEDTVGPYVVTVEVTDRLPLSPAQMWVNWRMDGGAWQPSSLVPGEDGTFLGNIPGQPASTVVEYYFEVTDSQGVTTREPLAAPAAVHRFVVGPDTTAPSLAHRALGDQPLVSWPPVVRAQAADNLGLDRVELAWRLGDGPWQGPVSLEAAGGGVYSATFPVAVADLQPGLSVTYAVTAWDVANVPNATVSGPHAFTVVDAPGVVLLIDDGGGATVRPWLADAGYVVDVVAPAAVDVVVLAAHQVTVLASGGNGLPILSVALRATLRVFALEGGRLLIEGGETGAAALVALGDLPFAHDVLHCTEWQADAAGPLQPVVTHPVLTYPHVLPASLPVDFAGASSQDACTPAADAVLVMSSPGWPTSAGLLVFDDRIVYLACDAGALAPDDARHLIENAMAYLLASEGPPSATIAGRVVLTGAGDASGVTVNAGGQVAVTGPDGLFEVGPLAQGTYVVTATCSGYLDGAQVVAVAHAQHLAGVTFTLVPGQTLQYVDAPQAPIPDGGGGGVLRSLTVAEYGVCAGISVDIAIMHPQIGDLVVSLISPAGSLVRLHDRSGGDADGLVGNWPATLVVDGPGDLADLVGEDVHGTWLLYVSDAVAGNAGVWRSWALNLLIPAPLTAVDDDGPPLATRLVGNAPNPFNPQTVVSFDLAHDGPVRVDVFDVRGRLVRRLAEGSLPAGRQTVVWDGRDDVGREVASGTYLARLTADGGRQMSKMMLVR